MYRKFPSKKFKKFNEWLKSPSGGERHCSEEIVSEVNRFLYFCCLKKIKWKQLFETKLSNNYLIITKKAGMGPDGIKIKVERIMTALKYLKHWKPKLCKKCERAMVELKEWLWPLVRKKRVLRMKNSWRDELCGFSRTMQDVDTYGQAKVDRRRASTNRRHTDNFNSHPRKCGKARWISIHYIGRTGKSTNIHFNNRWYSLQHCVCVESQTFATHGPLPVPFGEITWIHLYNYLKYVRPQVEPKAPDQHLVFLNASGKMISQPSKAVTKVTKHHKKKITTTKVRHCIATVSSQQLTDVERQAVAKGIGHTMEVHDKVYTDLTMKAVQSSIEAQKKLHDKSRYIVLSKQSD